MSKQVYVLCVCNKGRNDEESFWTTKDYCLAKGCTPAAQATNPGGEKAAVVPDLFVYRLPSGKEIVGSHLDYMADEKAEVLVYNLVSPIPQNSALSDAQLVIAKLPSGQGVVQLYQESKMDGATTVVAKIIGRIEKL